MSATCHTGDRTILRHGFVVSMDEAIGDVPDCDILIEDGRIAAVRPGLPGVDAREIDASSAIVVPGFVDTPAPPSARRTCTSATCSAPSKP